MELKNFTPAPPAVFFSKQDSFDPRLGDLVKKDIPDTLTSHPFVLCGYPDDEGISLNGGRVGAKEAPDRVRHFLYRMTPNSPELQMFDAGNLSTSINLESRHKAAQAAAEKILSMGARLLSIGGGHDYAYPDGAAFLKYAQGKTKHKPLIINIDAHLDVRDTSKGLTSGTPFYRLLTEFKDQFDFVEIGIQNLCNSHYHREWLRAFQAKVITLEAIRLSGEPLVQYVSRELQDILVQPRPTFLSIDIDAFASSQAPGCSQSWPTGVEVSEFWPLLHLLINRLEIRASGIYEVSPPLDIADQTSKLAACLLHQIISSV